MRTNSEIRQQAKNLVKPLWFESVIAAVLVYLVISSTLAWAAILLTGPLYIGLIFFFTRLREEQKVDHADLVMGFRDHLKPAIIGFILKGVFTFLWSLLFVIPGIIKSFSYAMTLYIIKDNPSIRGVDAITQSRNMMKGHKMKLFRLYLGYIGWFILGIFTFGIAIIYIAPFIEMAVVEFYEDVKKEAA